MSFVDLCSCKYFPFSSPAGRPDQLSGSCSPDAPKKQTAKLQFVLHRIKAGADILDDSDLFRSTSLGVFTRSCEEPFVVGHSPFKSEAERREQSMSNSYLQLISTAHTFLCLVFNQKNTHTKRLHGLLATVLQQYL